MGCVLTAGQGQAPARQAALAAGCPVVDRRPHPEQGLRLGHAGRDDRRQRSALRRLPGRRRRRHGEHEPGALPRHGRPRRPPPRPRQARRLDDPRRPLGPLQRPPHGQLRRALRQPSTRSAARSRTPTRWRATAAPGRRPRTGCFADEIVPVEVPAEEGRSRCVVDRDEEPFKVDLARMTDAQAGLPEGRRHGDRGQRQQDQRRRRRPGADHGRPRRAARPEAARPHRGPLLPGPEAGVVHHRAGRRRQGGARAGRPQGRRHRPLGGQRGLRGGGARLQPGPRAVARPGQRARRRGGAGPPDRLLRRAHPGHPAARPAASATPVWAAPRSASAAGRLPRW